MSHRSSTLLLSLPPIHAFDFFPLKTEFFFFYFSKGACKQGNSNCMFLCCGYLHSQDPISLRKSVCSVSSFPYSLFFFPTSTKALKTKIYSSFCFFFCVTVTACISVAEEWSRQAGGFLCSVLLGPLKRSPQRNTYSNCANWVSHDCYLSLILTKR